MSNQDASVPESESEESVGPQIPVLSGRSGKRKLGADGSEGLRRLRRLDVLERKILKVLPKKVVGKVGVRDVVKIGSCDKLGYFFVVTCDDIIIYRNILEKVMSFPVKSSNETNIFATLSNNQEKLAILSQQDMTYLKILHIKSMDVINLIKFATQFTPSKAIFIDSDTILLCAHNVVRVYKYDTESSDTFLFEQTLDQVSSIFSMTFNQKANCLICSFDEGRLDIFFLDINKKKFILASSKTNPANLDFLLKMETDLYKVNVKCVVKYCNQANLFITTSEENIIRIFDFASCKIMFHFDESVPKYGRKLVSGKTFGLHKQELQKRILEASAWGLGEVCLDDSGKFLVVGCLYGIKVIHLKTKMVVVVLSNETNHYNSKVALHHPHDSIYRLITHSDEELLVFGPSEKSKPALHDGSGVKPANLAATSWKDEGKSATADSAVVHTSMGDITLMLYPSQCPKTVTNFVTHAKQGYYNNMVFHRVIKDFMIQTGDPEGNGTGGVSIYGDTFEDEFVDGLTHEEAFMLSMANAGPGTNGSQFFITTVKAPWLDKKHTVFGKVANEASKEVVRAIEAVNTDRDDKPTTSVLMFNITIK